MHFLFKFSEEFVLKKKIIRKSPVISDIKIKPLNYWNCQNNIQYTYIWQYNRVDIYTFCVPICFIVVEYIILRSHAIRRLTNK